MASKREAVAKAERAFKLFDKDNDGYITKEEFQKISKKLNKQQARPNRIAVIAFSDSLFLIELGNDILCFHLMKQKFYNNILKTADFKEDLDSKDFSRLPIFANIYQIPKCEAFSLGPSRSEFSA